MPLHTVMKPALGLSIVLCMTLLVGCPAETVASPPPIPDNPPAPDNPLPPDNPPDPDEPPADGACANVLRGSIDLPTTLVNTPSECDYLLEGQLEVGSTLRVEPGVVVRATLSSRIVVEEADFIAVGTPENRILFEGLEHAQGYWGGIYLNDARPSRIEYVDIKDAGQTCKSCEGGLQLSKVVTSLVSSSVSNSFTHGLSVDNNVEFTAFAENRFYGNALAGVRTEEGRAVPQFDTASDYLGLEKPNGRPYVDVKVTVSVKDVGERVWKQLNAPYYVDALGVTDGVLVLEPGVEMIFPKEYRLTFKSRGSLRAVGTANDPIIFRGEKAEREHWSGLWFDQTGSRQHVLEHVDIRDTWTAVFLKWGVNLKISNSRIQNSTNGVTCDVLLFQDTILELGPNVTFETANREVDEDCKPS